MGSLDFPLCTICKNRHAKLDGHKWDTAPKPVLATASSPPPPEPITVAQVTKKLTETLPKAEAKEFKKTVDRIAHRKEQVRQAVARHRAKKKAGAQPVSNGNQV